MALPARPAGLLLTPGASGDRDDRTLVALDEALELPVERITIRSRSEAKVFAQLRDDIDAFADRIGADPADLVIGGRSFGGRMCSMLVADGQPVAGLALLSYPLHPPGTPEKLRTAHFPALDVPVLFASGTKDPFGTPEEFAEHAAAIPGPVTWAWLEGQNHSPRKVDLVVDAVRTWVG